MAVSARSMTSRIADAVQGVLEAATRLIDVVMPVPQPRLVPVRVKSRSRDGNRR
ncbi:hypothetical protein [Methylobacterium sp. sgz302541]|uniref:hypothetical protein n=1 Tax=unclassified Methylobacterium TaxID=2615210 RepID=UPI003D357887